MDRSEEMSELSVAEDCTHRIWESIGKNCIGIINKSQVHLPKTSTYAFNKEFN